MTPPTDEERAREIVRESGARTSWGGAYLLSAAIAAALASARREGRREGIEEAAVIAEEHSVTCGSDVCCRMDAEPCDSHAQVITRAIRALATPAQEEKPKTEIPDWFWGSLR